MCSEDGLSTRHRDEHLQFQVGGGWRGGRVKGQIRGHAEAIRRATTGAGESRNRLRTCVSVMEPWIAILACV